MRVLVFGDSITYGIWDSQGGWVQRLRSHYDKNQIADNPFRYDQPSIFNMGIGGDHSDDVLKRFDTEVNYRMWPNEPFAFIFAVGINDSYSEEGKNYSTPEKYAENLKQLIIRAKDYSDKIAFIGISPVDERQRAQIKEGGYKNARILIFEKTLKQVCRVEGVGYIPIFDQFKAKLDAGDHLMDDGLHPNDTGHQLIFELVRSKIEKVLGE